VDIGAGSNLQQLLQLADWVQQHSGIISRLGLWYGLIFREDSTTFQTATEQLSASIQAAAVCDRCRLGFSSIRPAGRLLQQLPAGSLTELRLGERC
jgi:hypothetical protein